MKIKEKVKDGIIWSDHLTKKLKREHYEESDIDKAIELTLKEIDTERVLPKDFELKYGLDFIVKLEQFLIKEKLKLNKSEVENGINKRT